MSEDKSLPDIVEDLMKAVVQIVTPSGQGTGFFIRDDGLVITNKHVVDKDIYVKVKTQDGGEYDGQVVKGDVSRDHAFLFTNAPVKKVLTFGDSDSVRVAETVVAIGHPYGYSFTVSEGIVSAIERHEVVPGLNSVGFLQLDAGINPGNSGGPLIRRNGEVLGMITMTLMNAKGLSFAIPARIIINAIDEMKGITKEEALSLKYCNVCGYLNSVEDKYCQKCGATLEKPERPAGYGDVLKAAVIADESVEAGGATISCPSCAAINSATGQYCKKCGVKLGTKAAASNITSAASDTSKRESTCPSCNTKGSAGSYCSKCGTLLK